MISCRVYLLCEAVRDKTFLLTYGALPLMLIPDPSKEWHAELTDQGRERWRPFLIVLCESNLKRFGLPFQFQTMHPIVQKCLQNQIVTQIPIKRKDIDRVISEKCSFDCDYIGCISLTCISATYGFSWKQCQPSILYCKLCWPYLQLTELWDIQKESVMKLSTISLHENWTCTRGLLHALYLRVLYLICIQQLSPCKRLQQHSLTVQLSQWRLLHWRMLLLLCWRSDWPQWWCCWSHPLWVQTHS